MSATVKMRQTAAARALGAAGIETAGLDARLLMAHALGIAPDDLWRFGERTLSDSEGRRFEAVLERRLAREPAAYILGEREFWSLPIGVDPSVLIPRPDSETVIEALLSRLGNRRAELSILDLGTGSGCLLAALLRELPVARGIGVDLSLEALSRARRTLEALGLGGRTSLVCADWTKPLRGAFDIIVSNPPYIPAREVETLAPEIRRYEPALALIAGADGLDAYRAIVPNLASLLAPAGLVALEFGEGQGPAVEELAVSNALETREFAADLAGRCRVLVAGRAREKKSWIRASEPLVCVGV